jgi:hypothetical protein
LPTSTSLSPTSPVPTSAIPASRVSTVTSVADTASRARRFLTLVALTTCAIGIGAALVYHAQGLTLSHYDAKAHLVVARRIVDSLRPGWWQVGAVWLPLPHLVNLLPVQIDWMYRTGFSGVAISIACFSIASTTIAWMVRRATGCLFAASAAVVVFASQPDVLYLQSTPMTEPLLMALCLLGVALTWAWTTTRGEASTVAAGTALALACLTRYEAWPITAAALGLSAVSLLLTGVSARDTIRRVGRVSLYPLAAILAFLVLSRATVGSWLVTDGFYLIDNADYGRPFKSMGSVWWGMRRLNGPWTMAIGVGALAVVLIEVARTRAHRALLVVLALAGCAALPYYAFFNGHPFRIRYMVVLVMILATVTGLGIGLLRRGRLVVALLVGTVALVETPPLSERSPMVVEAQWDVPRSRERAHVTACLSQRYDGEPILASMGSLAHYMQETSHAGFELRDYIHEGIGQIWTDSLVHAYRHAGWVLIEEQAEGGDVLAHRRQASPAFLAGFERVCEGGGVALYRRVAPSALRAQ